MNRLIAFLSGRPTPPAPTRSEDPVRQLMERAGALAGHDPRQAGELRQAAFAWLRVVR